MPIAFPSKNRRDDAEDFISLKDGESVTGIIRGAPVVFFQHWINGVPVNCPGKGQCENCAKGVKSGFRGRFNFIIKKDGAYIPKILEQGSKVYDVIEELQVSHGYDLERTVLKISRKGSGFNDTTYLVIPAPGQNVSDELHAQLSSMKLLDLTPKPKEAKTEENFQTMDDIPF